METRTVELIVTSFRDQEVTLIARHGIDEISASAGVLGQRLNHGAANCDLNLPQGKPVDIHLKLGIHTPSEWASQVAMT